MKKPLALGFLITLVLLCSCDPDKKVRENPLIHEWSGNFGLPPFDAIKVADYEPAIEYAVKLHTAEIEDIVDNKENPSFDNVILPLDSSGRRLQLVWGLFSLACGVDAGGKMDSLNMRMGVKMAVHEDAILHNADLFEKVRAVYDGRLSSDMDSLQLRLTELTYRRFIRGGAALNDVKKAVLRKVNEGLVTDQVLYATNLTDSRNEIVVFGDSSEIDGIPFIFRHYASELAKEAGKPGRFLFTMEDQVVHEVLTMARSGELRERVINASEKVGAGDSIHGNSRLVWDIVRLRNEKAGLLGYGTYAAYRTGASMAGDTQAATGMLDGIWELSVDSTLQSEQHMKPVRPSSAKGNIKKWDWDFYLTQLRKRVNTVDQEQLEAYFPLVNVRLGAFELCNRLFGLTFRPIQPDLYNTDCEAYEVFDVDNNRLGIMIFDYYSRPGKRSGSWTHCVRTRWPYGGDYSDPVTCSVFNFIKPYDSNRAALLSFADVKEMFRQVGNAVEMMFADTPYAGLQRLEPDMAGVTGELLKYWAFEPQLMANYALHYATGNQLSETNLKRIYDSRNYDSAYDITRNAASSYLDIDVHMNMAGDSLMGNEGAFENEFLVVKRGLPNNIGLQYSLSDFGPVFGSSGGAGFYGRLWTGMLAADIFGVFRDGSNLFDSQTANRLREDILSKGSSAPAEVLFRNFRGRDVSINRFLVYNGLAPEFYLESELEAQQSAEPQPVQPVDTLPAPVPALELWKPNRSTATQTLQPDNGAGVTQTDSSELNGHSAESTQSLPAVSTTSASDSIPL